MIYMINKIFIGSSFFLLCSCNTIGTAFTYTDAAKFIQGYVAGFPEDKISSEQLDNFEASFANIKIGRGPSSLVVLAYTSNGSHEWVSNDGVQVFTNKGHLYKTMGLSSDVTYEPVNYLDSNLLNTSFTTSATFYKPDLFLISVENFITKSDTKILLNRPEDDIEATVYIHEFYVPSIKWRGENRYFVNSAGLIMRSEQYVHPNLSKFKIDFFYKF